MLSSTYWWSLVFMRERQELASLAFHGIDYVFETYCLYVTLCCEFVVIGGHH